MDGNAKTYRRANTGNFFDNNGGADGIQMPRRRIPSEPAGRNN